jgi:hypothetical protein
MLYNWPASLYSNVSPCVARRTLLRDESIVLESQIFSYLVYEVVIPKLLS